MVDNQYCGNSIKIVMILFRLVTCPLFEKLFRLTPAQVEYSALLPSTNVWMSSTNVCINAVFFVYIYGDVGEVFFSFFSKNRLETLLLSV